MTLSSISLSPHLDSRYSVFGECYVEVVVPLNDASRRQDRFLVCRVEGQSVAQMLEGLLKLPHLRCQQ